MQSNRSQYCSVFEVLASPAAANLIRSKRDHKDLQRLSALFLCINERLPYVSAYVSGWIYMNTPGVSSKTRLRRYNSENDLVFTC